MNDVYVFRAVPYQQDSRTVRYKNLLKGNVIFNCWEDYYSNSSGLEIIKLGKKRFSKFLVYPLYLIYLLMYSLFKVKKGSISICMDLDTFIPVYLGSKLVGNKVVLDIVDPISQTRFSKFKFNKIFDFIEIFIIKYRGDVILPLENRVQFYLDRLNLKWNIPSDNYIVLENVPEISINSTGVFVGSKIENRSEDVKRIGYFGTLDSSRGLLELIEFVKKFPSYELYLSGRGSFVDVIVSESENFKNIKFLGPYHPNDISELYNKVDFVWAFYCHPKTTASGGGDCSLRL
ncbi:hypothetical protein [Shewanella sp. KJ2020]|uniref:hypothetical protein n=1 Tax=Shewanella sp. KJ2020 TaxID=2919172 RepID=UPI0020A81274|nr:hypothetical protein [Shewanella sp. KJ2020]MCP3130339.1 hypothetical protein [Shewanella sp. KJ2020]